MKKYNPKLGMTQPEYMWEHGFVMLIGTSASYEKRMKEFMDDKTTKAHHSYSHRNAG